MTVDASEDGRPFDDDLPVERIVEELSVSFEPFFLIPDPGRGGRCERAWRELLGDHVIQLESPEDTIHASAALIGLAEGVLANVEEVAERLRESGLDRDRVARVAAAVTPYAATLPRGRRRAHLH